MADGYALSNGDHGQLRVRLSTTWRPRSTIGDARRRDAPTGVRNRFPLLVIALNL